MRPSEAAAVVAAIQAFRPWPAIPPETQDAWASVLEAYDFRDGMDAVPVVGRAGGFLELAAIEEAVKECRDSRLAGERLALPAGSPSDGISFREWFDGHATAEQQTTARRVFPAVCAKFGNKLLGEISSDVDDELPVESGEDPPPLGPDDEPPLTPDEIEERFENAKRTLGLEEATT
jgi:hypothetical protein